MAVNAQKIRLGAPDSMILFGSIDLGASVGGIELNYNPTTFEIEVDQAIMPLASYRTKEEVSFDVALVQIQMNLVAIAFGYGNATVTDVTTVASGTLGTPGAAVPTVVGTPGSTTYSYKWVAWDSNGDSLPGTVGTISTGPASLSPTTYISIAVPAAVTGAVGFYLIRTAGGGSQGKIFTSYGVPAAAVSDTGLAATAYTDATSAAAYPSTDTMYFGGNMNIPNGTFDFGVPKNDGTNNHIRGHLHKVYAAKAIKLDWKRDKHTELSKLSLMALADTTQALNRWGGWLLEEY